MDRARRTFAAAFVLLVAAGLVAARGAPDPLSVATTTSSVSWPVSTTMLLAEVVTGGASASDEYIEITNAGPDSASLAGLELAYITSTGGTVTRKVSWSTAVSLESGRHLLVANASGMYAGVADAVYGGGLSASGGAVVLRPVGGAPIDAVAWGDATNGFIEGAPAPAPSAGSSIERKPGGIDGNTVDTNENALDWFVQASPSPQPLSAPPAPVPSPSPSATVDPSVTPGPTPQPTLSPSPEVSPTPSPTEGPTPTPAASPTSEPTPSPTPEPTPTPTPSPTPEPTPSPTPTPTPTPSPSPSPTPTPPATPTPSPSPTPSPTATPSSAPTPTPSPTSTPLPALPISSARALADGAWVVVEGILTTNLGALESGRTAFVQDSSAGIAIYLDASVVTSLPAGTPVRIAGTMGERYGQRVIRVPESAVSATAPLGDLPLPLEMATGNVGESTEGMRLTVAGSVLDSPSQLADGLVVTVDDGTGSCRAVVAPDADDPGLVKGARVRVTGPLGQRDSTGTGTSGYRIYATLPGELTLLAPPATPTPEPTPTPTPEPTLTPSPTPTATPAGTPTPTPAPTPTPTASPSPTIDPAPGLSLIPIADARLLAIGSRVRISGVVTAEPGRLGTPAIMAIQDGLAGIAVRLPDGSADPPRGTRVEVIGKLAEAYGQLELRVESGGYAIRAVEALPAPLTVSAGDLGESLEGRLIEGHGTLSATPTRATSGDITALLVDGGGQTVRVVADASSGVTAAAFTRGSEYRVVGVVGQHSSRKGSLDGYRIWIRDVHDIVRVSAPPSPTPTPTSSPSATNGSTPSPSSTNGTGCSTIAQALSKRGSVTVRGTVTAPASLLDTTGRRVVIQDATAAVEVLLPSGATPPAVGTRVEVAGAVTTAYGAPRIRASSVRTLAAASPTQPATLHTTPGARDEWRLVSVSGTIIDVRRLGARWLAEISMGGARVLVIGMPGSGIPSTALVESRSATITGVVRRPYPSASDQRFAILPRSTADVSVGPAGPAAAGSTVRGSTPSATASRNGTPGASRGAFESPDPIGVAIADVDIGQLEEHVGEAVRVGGLVVTVDASGIVLDDGTARGRVQLEGGAAAYLPLLHADDPLNAVGLVSAAEGRAIVIVDQPSGLLRVGDLGESVSIGIDPGAGPGTGPAGSNPAARLQDEPVEASAGGPSSNESAVSHASLGGPLDPSGFGFLSVLLVTSASGAATLARRQRRQRRLAARIAARLATIGDGPEAPRGSRPGTDL